MRKSRAFLMFAVLLMLNWFLTPLINSTWCIHKGTGLMFQVLCCIQLKANLKHSGNYSSLNFFLSAVLLKLIFCNHYQIVSGPLKLFNEFLCSHYINQMNIAIFSANKLSMHALFLVNIFIFLINAASVIKEIF